MQSLIFIAISIFIYFGAFAVGELIFNSNELSILFGSVAGGICFWWLVSKSKKLED